jgi:hypothetical protein
VSESKDKSRGQDRSGSIDLVLRKTVLVNKDIIIIVSK